MSALQQMQIQLHKAHRKKTNKNKPTQNKQKKKQPTFCHPADTKLQQVSVHSLLSY